MYQNKKNAKNRLSNFMHVAFDFHLTCLLLFTAHIQFVSASTTGSSTRTNLSNDMPPPPPPPPPQASSQNSAPKQYDDLNTFQRPPPPPPPFSLSPNKDTFSMKDTNKRIEARNNQRYENVNSDSNFNTFSSNVTPPPPPPQSHNQGQSQYRPLQNHQNHRPNYRNNHDLFRSRQNQEYPQNDHQTNQFSTPQYKQYQQQQQPSQQRQLPPFRSPPQKPPMSNISGKSKGRSSIFNQLAVKSRQDFSSILQKVQIVKKKIVPPFPMTLSKNDIDTPMQRKGMSESSSSSSSSLTSTTSIPHQQYTSKGESIRPSPALASSPPNVRSDSNWYTQAYDSKNSNDKMYDSSSPKSKTSLLDDIKASISLDTYNTDDHLSDSEHSDGDFDENVDSDDDIANHDETDDNKTSDLKGIQNHDMRQNYDNNIYIKPTSESSISASYPNNPNMSKSMKLPNEYNQLQSNSLNPSFQPPSSQIQTPPLSQSISSSIQPPNRNPLPSMSNTRSLYSSSSSFTKTQSSSFKTGQSSSPPFKTSMNQMQNTKARPNSYTSNMGPNPHGQSRPYKDNSYNEHFSSPKYVPKQVVNTLQIILAPFSRISQILIPSAFFSKLFNLKTDDSHAYLSMKNTATLLRDNGWDDDDDDDDDDVNSNTQVSSAHNDFDSNQNNGRKGYFHRNRHRQNKLIPSSPATAYSSIIPIQVTRLLQRTPNQQAISTYSSIGRNLGLLDAISLGFFILFLNDDNDSWGIYALPCSILTLFTSHVLYQNKIQRLAKEKAIQAWDDSKYAHLWNQLVSAVALDPKMPSTMAESAYLRVKSSIQLKRLSSYVNILTISILIINVSKDKVFVQGLVQTLWEIINMKSLHSQPFSWAYVWAELNYISIPWFERVRKMTTRAINFSIDNPLFIIGKFSLILALWFAAFLPQLEKWWVENHKKQTSIVPHQKNINVIDRSMDSNTVSVLGRSSCSRLQTTSLGVIRALLERWKMLQTSPIGTHESNPSTLRSLITSSNSNYKVKTISPSSFAIRVRSIVYDFLLLLIFSVPIFFATTSSIVIASDKVGPNLSKNLLQRIALFSQTFALTKKALSHFISSTQTDMLTRPYKSQLASSISQAFSAKKGSELELKAMIAPTKGIVVTDLWAAHNSKRAWATQGVSFQSRAGELVLILGENSTGKTRLLTTIAEIIFSPPKTAKSTTLVRGTVSVAGIDLVQHSGLRSHRDRVGVMLNDVRSVADISSALSGCTVEEILEPNSSLGTDFVSGIRDSSASSVTKQKDAMKIALQVHKWYTLFNDYFALIWIGLD